MQTQTAGIKAGDGLGDFMIFTTDARAEGDGGRGGSGGSGASQQNAAAVDHDGDHRGGNGAERAASRDSR